MFKFNALELYQWDYWKRPLIPLDEQIITVVGPNGSGKTTFLDSLRTLLNIKQSKGRDIHKYLRKDKVGIRAVVTNEAKTKNGSKPFGKFCSSPEVTLAITFHKKRGEKPRKRFFVLNGNIEMDQIINGELNQHDLGSNEYSERLAQAGLSKSVLKVLALEQGKTDDLVGKSSKDLLELVFDVFGDLNTIRRYEDAAKAQRDLETELEDTQKEYKNETFAIKEQADAITRFDEYNEHKHSYHKKTTVELKNAQTVQFFDLYKKQDALFSSEEKKCIEAQNSLLNIKSEHEDASIKFKEFSLERERLDHEKNDLQLQLNTNGAELNSIENAQAQFVELDKIYQEIEDKDVTVLNEKSTSLEHTFKELLSSSDQLSKQLNSDKSELKFLEENKNSNYTPKSESVQVEMEKQGIEAKALCKLVEIKDDKWKIAIESLIGNDRFNLIVTKEQHFEAMEIARQRGYRSFISPYEHSDFKDTVNKNSALSVLELSDKRIPKWVLTYLNNTCLIDLIKDAKTIKEFDYFITADGYSISPKGGRFVAVKDFYCGEKAVRDRIKTLHTTIKLSEEKLTELKLALEKNSSELSLIKDHLKVIQNWLDMSAKLNGADERLAELRTLVESLKTGLEEKRSRIEELIPKINESHDKEIELAKQLGKAEEHHSEENNRLKRVRTERHLSYNKLDQLINGENSETIDLPEETKTERINAIESEITDDMRRLKVSKVQADIELLSAQIEEYEEKIENNDTQLITEKIKENFEGRKSLLTEKEETLKEVTIAHKETVERTNQAIEAYVKSLRNSVKFYKQNVEDLAEVANADVTVKMPVFEYTMDSIRDAGLEIAFAFDGKKLHKLDSGESSGGQKVIESLILLIALLKDDRDSEGGFVFIDEPFAHLDVANVDRVGKFLQKTGSQYILTTPNTQNIGVFRPSKLMIATQKKHPNQEYANRPKYGKRKTDGSLVLE